ncbi:hypothetical protein BGHDH14_bgh04779 [Blumeria hordei DH14]|uniref:Prolyl 4-hydroxylase alpha subunit domain-containing protein n=1 Tax=Blumeria graminis f. sp. hordei (strain DH14) TaxID=546991 RepID=N1JN36_BLUG1|nr:hypothetical protein BGHDH14_bgh04779 [Blumeria hordei DH14]
MAPPRSTRKKPHPATSVQPSFQPKWPIFKPLPPPENLCLEILLPSQIILIRKFWTAALCKSYVDFLKTLPLATTPGLPKKGEALRVNDRFQIIDDAFALRIWEETGLKDLILSASNGATELGGREEIEQRELWGGNVIGLNPSIRIYRYRKGQFFDQHYDESNNVSIKNKHGPSRAKTTWTLLLYLTSPETGCQGGETVFYPDPKEFLTKTKKSLKQEEVVVGLETGMLLLHKHGEDCILADFSGQHEGREVLEGEKWVIRTDLCIKI